MTVQDGNLPILNRREFVQGISTAAVSGAVLHAVGARGEAVLSANDKVQIGVIGPGSRGQELIRQLLHLPNTEIVAVCDIYEPRFAQVNQLAGKTVPSYKDYRELLARTDLDAIVVATPIAHHAEHVIASIRSGRPVYGEKALGFTPDDCSNIVREVEKSRQIFQIGHEYRYAAWVQEAIKHVHEGRIGQPTHVYAYWHRNNDWRRPVPSLDPDGRLEHLINWRLYRETSGGQLTELGSHHIDIANWVFDEQPANVMGTMSLVRYHDGRTVGDNVQAIFGYSGGRRLFFSSLTDNAEVGNQLWIYGTEGSVQLTIEDATFYFEPKKQKAVAAQAEVIQKGIVTGASYQTKDEMPYRGPGEKLQVADAEDPTLAALRAFVHSVKTKQKAFADVRVGYASAICTSVGNQALLDESALKIPQMSQA
jgi:predicted dehydrogenase